MKKTKSAMLVAAAAAVLFVLAKASPAAVLAEYDFENGTADLSGHGLDGQLVGDAAVIDGRLFLPGGLDNSMSIPLDEFSPFDGLTNWTVSFEFQTVDGSTGALFSSDETLNAP